MDSAVGHLFASASRSVSTVFQVAVSARVTPECDVDHTPFAKLEANLCRKRGSHIGDS
jgi:hypothetical protein